MLNAKSVFDAEPKAIGVEDHHQFFVRLIRQQKTVEDLYLLSLRLANDLEEHDTYRTIQQRLEALIDGRRRAIVNRKIRNRMTWPWAPPAVKAESTLEYFDRLVADMKHLNPPALESVAIAMPGHDACPRCFSQQRYYAIIHDGQSLRLDCAGCGRFIDFPVWHDAEQAKSVFNWGDTRPPGELVTKVVHFKREPYDVYIGRRPRSEKRSKWGNPFKIGKDGNRTEVIEKFRQWITNGDGRHLLADLEELRGKVLGCWCSPQPCHGDVLIELLKETQGVIRS